MRPERGWDLRGPGAPRLGPCFHESANRGVPASMLTPHLLRTGCETLLRQFWPCLPGQRAPVPHVLAASRPPGPPSPQGLSASPEVPPASLPTLSSPLKESSAHPPGTPCLQVPLPPAPPWIPQSSALLSCLGNHSASHPCNDPRTPSPSLRPLGPRSPQPSVLLPVSPRRQGTLCICGAQSLAALGLQVLARLLELPRPSQATSPTPTQSPQDREGDGP